MQNRSCWASWNCLEESSEDPAETNTGATARAVCCTYWLNHLQNLPEDTPELFCTLNPTHPPSPGSVLRRLQLAHPVFGPQAEKAQEDLHTIQVRDVMIYRSPR
eukprot:1247-Prorocentrum_minimum.AAC.2